MKKILFFAVALFSAGSLFAQSQIVAHRGFHATGNSVRNSLSALVNAQEYKFFGSECDINETKDGVLIVVHGLNHADMNVQETDYATLKAAKLENGETIPTLEEYLIQAKKNTATKLIIEIKSHATPERETRVTKNILAMVKKYKLKKDVEYIAFSKHVCQELVKYGPKGIQVAYLYGELTPLECKQLGFTGIDYNHGVLKKHPEWIKAAQALGLTVNIWTVNSTADIQWSIDQGVDYITTDNPLEAKRLIEKK